MLQETLLTAEGLKELEQELETLKTVGRKEAAEKINEMFGLNIEVYYREDYREIDNEIMLPAESGDGEVSIIAGDGGELNV